MASSFLFFSFVQGIVAFFAPCAVALLPGYISTLLTRSEKKKTLFSVLLYAFLTIVGIALVYSVIGLGFIFLSAITKRLVVYIVLVLGVVFIILGGYMIVGKQLSLPIHGFQVKRSSPSVESFLFGLSYGLTALGCLFPLFLIVLFSALQAQSAIIGFSYVLAYIVGMGLFMVLFYIVTLYAKEFLQKWVLRFMPYIVRIGGILVVLAGLHMVWYQWGLL